MSRSRGWLVLALLVAGLALVARSVGAQPWYQSYGRGLELERQGAWALAVVEFQAAAAAKPLPAERAPAHGGDFVTDYDPYYHLALCLVEMGRPGLATQELRRSVAARVTPPEKLRALRDRIQATAARTAPPRTPPTAPLAAGRLAVESDPPGASIYVDEISRGRAPLAALALPAGLHVLRADLAGYRSVERHVTIVPGDTSTLLISLAAAPPVRTTTAAQAPDVRRQSSTPTPGPPPPQLTSAVACLPQTAVVATPAPVRTFTTPQARRPLRGLGAVAVLALLALAATLWLRSRRRRAPGPPSPTPTGVADHATTVAERGGRLGAYELQGVLGRGGMATTFRARRAGDGQLVAVKVPHDACLADRTFVARFLREGKLGEQLHHPGIVRVLAASEEDGRPYLAMELLSGRTLKDEIRAIGPLPLRRALEIARDIAEALDYAHAKGVVHRDLKPENVMIAPDGSVKVMDFGIARMPEREGLTTSNVFLGTPLYAAPEMVDPKSVDHRADLYALGIVLYEMLEGAVPFVADSPYRVLEMHQRAPLPSRGRLARRVPERLWAVVTRLCEKEPERRYPGAEALLVELNGLLHDFPDLDGDDVF